MAHVRFFAAIVTLSASGAMWVAGPTLSGEREASGAARATAKSTIARPTRARRSNEPSMARRASDASKSETSAVVKEGPTRERDAQTEKSPAPKGGERGGSKSFHESASNTKSAAADTRPATPSESSKPGDVAQGRSADVLSGRTAERIDGRSTDPRPSAAKTPNDVPSSAKATAEKVGNESAAGDLADAPRSAFDVAPATRRDLASPSLATSAARAAVVALEGPIFDGGDVPRAAAALDRMKTAFARCASVENALTKNEASIDLRFLVRAPGRAEGVNAEKARGVSSDVVRCMTSVLARSYVGAPSDDPVGVAVTVRVRRAEAGNN